MKSVHEGHRQRTKERFLSSDSSSFSSHELLEMLLFYSIPRRNTNDLAHELFSRFGSLKRIGCADIKELCMVEGISESSAVLLKLMIAIAERCVSEDIPKKLLLDNESLVVEYGKKLFVGANNEVLYLLSLDSDLRLLDCSAVSFGTINEIRPIIRSIVEKCILSKATNVIILHNHESGLLEPSEADISFTVELYKILKVININFIDHFIIANNESTAVLKNTDGKLRYINEPDKIIRFYK